MANDDLLIERLLRVVDEGRRTATYKLALLLAIVDAVALSPGESELPTRFIAERVLSLYYRQTRPFVDIHGGTHQPRQISMKSSAAVAAVERLRSVAEQSRYRNVDEVRALLPDEFADAVDAIEDVFVRYPIPLMQVVGSNVVPFLYAVDWSEGTSAKTLKRAGADRVRLLDGVADRLAVLGPMLRSIIELHWTRDVARWTRLPMDDELLRVHLFGSERVSFPRALVGELSAMQGDTCFYCGARLGSRRDVDHFLAWSRWPNDAIENLVIADQCNGAKADHLAATVHLTRWRLRLETKASDLAQVANKHRWPSARDRTWALAQTTYTHVAAGTPLWLRGKEFEFAGGPLLA